MQPKLVPNPTKPKLRVLSWPKKRRKPRATYAAYPPIDQALAGNVEVCERDLKRKLGYTTVELLKLLMQNRSIDGTTRLTFKTMEAYLPGLGSNAKGLPGSRKEKVRWALDRLRAFGLLRTPKTKKFFKFVDPITKDFVEGFYMYRIVAGRYVPNEALFIVPAETLTAVKEGYLTPLGRKKWGGKRAGAGHPKMHKTGLPNVCSASKGEGMQDTENAEVWSEIEGRVLESKKNQVPDPEAPKTLSSTPPHVSNTYKEDHSKRESVFLSSKEERNTRANSATPFSFQEKHSSTIGTSFGPTVKTKSPTISIPASLFFDSLRPAVVPNPPMLSPDLSEDDLILTLVRAYRGASESRFPNSSQAFNAKLQAIDRNRQDKFVEVARMLQDKGISPFAWAAFSCDVWKKAAHRNPPRIDWVFLISRVEQRAGWFKSELSDYTGQRVIYGPKATALLRKHESMRMSLMTAPTDDAKALLFERFFPGDSFEELLEEARAEGDAERTRLKEALTKGQWLWR